MLKVLATIQKYNTILLIAGSALTLLGFAWRLKRKLTEEKDYVAREDRSSDDSQSANFSQAQSVFRRMQS